MAVPVVVLGDVRVSVVVGVVVLAGVVVEAEAPVEQSCNVSAKHYLNINIAVECWRAYLRTCQ